ncbi:MAG: hypothetical protein GXP18_01050 [Gammaproteobacteria bacterium]|nr:hypothetical protein [Gammaproteobacteria bacterium]
MKIVELSARMLTMMGILLKAVSADQLIVTTMMKQSIPEQRKYATE